MADRQAAGLAARAPPQLCGDCGDGLLVAGDDDGAGAVDRGDGDPVAVERGRTTSSSVASTASHRAAGGQGLHQPAAGGDQRQASARDEHPGDVGGGELADGVAGEVVGAHAPGLEQPEQRDLDGEQRGLGVAGLGQQALAPSANMTSRSEPPSVGVERGADLVEGGGEDGEGARTARGPCRGAGRPGR